VTKHCEILIGMTLTDPRIIFVKGYVEYPVDTVFIVRVPMAWPLFCLENDTHMGASPESVNSLLPYTCSCCK
jgi:hypothetical protein